MISQENIQKIKKAVHQPLSWEDYNSTSVIENTNCFAHAIGSTVTADRSAYRLGMLSGKKKKDEEYISKKEIKNLFLDDVSVLELQVEEIPFENLKSFLDNLHKTNFADNEYIVALFVKISGRDEKILDFHFLRYDQGIDWTEKRWKFGPHFIQNVTVEWPSAWNDRLVGIFKITR